MTHPPIGVGPILEWSPHPSRAAATSARGRRTREAILAAALRVFGRKGFADIAVADIADEAGIASGTVYRYFVDKADIFRSLLASVEQELYSQTLIPTDHDGHLLVHDAVVAYFRVYRRNASTYRAWRELLEPGSEFEHTWVAMHQRFQDGIRTVVQYGQRHEIIARELDARLVSELVVAMFDQPAYTRLDLRWDPEVDDEDMAQAFSTLLRASVAQGAASVRVGPGGHAQRSSG